MQPSTLQVSETSTSVHRQIKLLKRLEYEVGAAKLMVRRQSALLEDLKKTSQPTTEMEASMVRLQAMVVEKTSRLESASPAKSVDGL